MVEMAIALPIFMVLLFGMQEFGLAFKVAKVKETTTLGGLRGRQSDPPRRVTESLFGPSGRDRVVGGLRLASRQASNEPPVLSRCFFGRLRFARRPTAWSRQTCRAEIRA